MSTNREARSEKHRGDCDSLDLLGAQNDLVKAVVETGTPTVVFLVNGRPLSINYIAEHVPAILEGWYLGQEGGTAAANVLFGDVNPGGKLPITFPHSVGDLPDFYNHKPSANRSYAFSTRQPLFPFGYGLSYTTFSFENLRVEPKQIQIGGAAKVMLLNAAVPATGLYSNPRREKTKCDGVSPRAPSPPSAPLGLGHPVTIPCARNTGVDYSRPSADCLLKS